MRARATSKLARAAQLTRRGMRVPVRAAHEHRAAQGGKAEMCESVIHPAVQGFVQAEAGMASATAEQQVRRTYIRLANRSRPERLKNQIVSIATRYGIAAAL